MQLGANDVDTTLAVGALNNIIANNNLTAEFGSINTAALLANSTQAALNETLGPIKLYPLRVGAGVTAECTQAFLTPATYYALETAYSGTLPGEAILPSTDDAAREQRSGSFVPQRSCMNSDAVSKQLGPASHQSPDKRMYAPEVLLLADACHKSHRNCCTNLRSIFCLCPCRCDAEWQ